MSYIYKFCVFILILAAGYTLFGVGHFKWMYYSANNPKADFLVSGNQNSDETFIEFLNYGCDYCKAIHPVVEELKEVRKDLRYIVRPIPLGDPADDKLTRIALAAGLQGKFEEMHQAFLEYPEVEIPDDFIEETASLYGINYTQMMKDADGKKVSKIINDNLAALTKANVMSIPAFMVKDQIYLVTDNAMPDLKQLLTIVSPSS